MLVNIVKYCISLIIEVSMSVKTNNIYGKIVISNTTIGLFVSKVSNDCYGIVKFVHANFKDAVHAFMQFGAGVKGVKIRTSGDRICIDLSVVVKYGVSIKAVVDALKESVKYKVEKFTGMIVDSINVKVCGVEK